MSKTKKSAKTKKRESDEISLHAQELRRLAPSFGQGLQMTNILKDTWEDMKQDSCWLPRDVFSEYGVDLSRLDADADGKAFEGALEHLIAVAHGHLVNAVEYGLHIPPHETGIRRFLFWNINMAVLTLRSIHNNPGYRAAEEVKISRGKLLTTILMTNLMIRSDTGLRSLFSLFEGNMPTQSVDQHFFDEIAQFTS